MKWQTLRPCIQSLEWIILHGCILSGMVTAVWSADDIPDWQTEIEPVFNDHCVKCHGPLKTKANLDLSTFHGLIKGSEQGPVLKPGAPEKSPLYTVLLEGSDPHMPPKKQLPQASVDLIHLWIRTFKEISPIDRDNPIPLDALPPQVAIASLQPPKSLSPSQSIDFFIEAKGRKADIPPAPVCDDRTFQRRLYLDLIGRPPTLQESNPFLRNGSITKRAEEAELLLGSKAFRTHFAELFDVFLMERRGKRWENERQENGWHEFLQSAFAENRPWDEVIRDIILARPKEALNKQGALWFLYERDNNYQAMAEAIAPIVFGTQIKCAQCHDHPLAHEIKQGHYWGMVAALNRSKNIKTAHGIGISESAIGGFISFANLKKESQLATLSFLNGVTIDEKRPAPDVKESDLPEYYLIAPPADQQAPQTPSIPKFSRREALANAVTQDNPLLAKSMVNRVWALLMGRGMVHPVDEMNSKHPPSHPGLLNWLSEDFIQHGYDVQRLMRIMVLSETYQRSAWTGPNKPHVQDSFAWAVEKPLTAETIYRSILQACGLTPDDRQALERTQDLRQALIEFFPDVLPVEYNATMQQAMFLSNSPLLQTLLEPADNNTTQQLLELNSPSEQVRQAFLKVHGRWPDQAEFKAAIEFLERRKDRPEAGIQQLLWSLITSAEFLTNH